MRSSTRWRWVPRLLRRASRSGRGSVVRRRDLPFVDAGGPARLHLDGQPQRRGGNGREGNLAPAVLLYRIAGRGRDRFPFFTVPREQVPGHRKAAFAAAGIVE